MKQIYSRKYYDNQYLCAAPRTKFVLILEMEGFLFCKKAMENTSKTRKNVNEITNEEFEFKYNGTSYKSQKNVIQFLDLSYKI